jgi:hypothetical protein
MPMHILGLARALALLVCLIATGPARAQSSELTVHQGPAIAGFRTEHALTGDWQIVDVYVKPNQAVRMPTGRPWIEYIARRSSGLTRESGSISWTSSRDCPALYNTLVWLTTLVAPRVEIAGVTPSEADPAGRRPVTIVADGLVTTVWGYGTQPDYVSHTRVEITSNGGLIAEFGRAATENLATCWTDAEPVF